MKWNSEESKAETSIEALFEKDEILLVEQLPGLQERDLEQQRLVQERQAKMRKYEPAWMSETTSSMTDAHQRFH